MALTINQEKRIRKDREARGAVATFASDVDLHFELARKVAEYRRAQKIPPETKGGRELRVTLLAEIDVLLAKLGVE
jgi:hypothetical protein